MLNQPTLQTRSRGAVGRSAGRRSDRAMDILQYGTAVFAIVVAILLAAFH